MDMKRVEEIEAINDAPGYVFYGDISEDGTVSQDVVDASGHFDFLIQTIKQQQAQIDGLKNNLKETYQFLADKDVWLQKEADEEIKALEES